MTHRELLLFCAIGVLGGGCVAAADADPSQGGLGNALTGVVGGEYQRRIDRKEEAIWVEQSRADALMARGEALRMERDQLALEITRSRERLAALNERLADLRTRAYASQIDAGMARARLEALEQELAAADGQASRMVASNADVDTETLRDGSEDLSAKIDALSADMDLLLGLIESGNSGGI